MIFTTQIFAVATLVSTLASALPLDNRDIFPRNKSYDVVNVGGGTPTATKTIEVIKPGSIVEVTATVTKPAPAPPTITTACTSSSISSAASSTSAASTQTPKPIYVTVVVPADEGPYYDDGMWHTKYRVKTFDAASVPTSLATVSSSTTLPALETPGLSYNATTA